ncbi:MAG: hypothetical protein UU04_C0013G0001 [Candidatus Uhrbacteria bacterium GW2011_GWC2_40_450]|nr:MAG: hypothetical protein UU04_C0013G0001 [Candidatus Uhrbacteria bacterium GW2011_GWC2_40_450]KKS07588.1 MAG: hypothetical protein UU62_C0014G0001 [Candidatus Uhrbacteria bacterium GW2011_GWF2_41_40]KKS50853.1 MAG: hypothetical protein UV15_C0014G0001 [Candidatus Uhrbacteria bacterium GW2011_GWA2_42_220]
MLFRNRPLYVNGRRRAVVSHDHRSREAYTGWLEIIPAEQAESEYQEKLARARQWDVTYQANLERVARALWEAGVTEVDWLEDDGLRVGDWTYVSGQMNGYFRNADWSVRVSANGALRRAVAIDRVEWRPVDEDLYSSAEELRDERQNYGARY